MEGIKNTHIEINLNDGSIMISGREEFVEKNMSVIFEFVEKNACLALKGKSSAKGESERADSEQGHEHTKSGDLKPVKSDDKYIQAGVYHIDSEDGTIAILKKIPGNSKSEKMKNIALIVLYIRKEKVLGKDLIPICEKHACYDSSNFSAAFKNEKTNIVRKGSGQSWTIELTQPGEVAAVELLEAMANDKK